MKRMTCLVSALVVGSLAIVPARLTAQTITKITNAIPAVSDTTSGLGRIPTGSNGSGDDLSIYAASVVKDGPGDYKMWYAASDGGTNRIFHATSSNGLDWVKFTNAIPAASDGVSSNGCIPVGTSTTKGDGNTLHSPCVIKDGTGYRMWYAGRPTSSGSYSIFLAESSNGQTWTKVSNMVQNASNTTSSWGRIPLGTTTRGDTNNVMWPSVIKDGDTYRMWYAGQGGTPYTYRIFHATSTNGYDWVKMTNGVEEATNGLSTLGRIPLGTGTAGDTNSVTVPVVIKHGMTYLMWYSGSTTTNLRTYLATSPDGSNWTKVENSIPSNSNTSSDKGRIPLGVSGTGDDRAAICLSAVDEGDYYRLWYRGDKQAGTTTSRVYSAIMTKDFPTIGNVAASNVGATGVTLAGNVTGTGQAPTTVHVYWGTNDAGLNLADWGNTNEFAGDAVTGAINTNLTGLTPLTTYFFRFFATNAHGFCMADPVGTFTTGNMLPVIQNATVADVTAGSATLNGYLSSTGESSTAVSVYWGTNNGEMVAGDWQYTNDFPGAQAVGPLSTSVTFSVTDAMYYYRFRAVNADGAEWAPASEIFLGGNVTVTDSDNVATRTPFGEPDTGILTIQRADTATNEPLTVYYAWSGTAVEGVDYTLSPSGTSVTLDAGVAGTNIEVTAIWNPDGPQGTKSLWLTLLPGTYGIAPPGSNSVTIADYSYTPGANATTNAGDWNSSAAWSLGRPPLPGDDVTVTHSLLLSNTTALINSLTVSNATLTFTNLETVLRATLVHVMTNGVIRHVTNSATATVGGVWVPDAKVRIACTDLTIDLGGRIHGDSAGFTGGPTEGQSGRGPGGGGWVTSGGQRGGGGGYGANGGAGASAPGGGAYGGANVPLWPGSGGGGASSKSGSAGGGLIEIVADGTVQINGNLTADGGNLAGSFADPGAGSGGGILIQASVLTGSGQIRATGGTKSSGPGGGGGGGRIVLDVADGSAWSGTVSVAGGTSTGSGVSGGYGTLHLSHVMPGILSETMIGRKYQIYGVTSWSPTSLTLSNSVVSFREAGFQLTVSSALTVGYASEMRVAYDSATAVPVFRVGTDMTLISNSTVHVFSGVTNAVSPSNGVVLDVGGALSVGTNCTLYLYSHSTNGGSPLVRAQSVSVLGSINADGTGYAGSLVNGYGPGGGKYYNGTIPANGGGGGHGGRGGIRHSGGNSFRGATNGIAEAPGSGSGGGGNNGTKSGARGGGAIVIQTPGELRVDGSLTANGGVSSGDGGGGSGGGIYLRCRVSSGSGLLSANGGNGTYSGGGGGRIAVWHSISNFTGTVTVDPGTGGAAGYLATTGTVVWVYLPPPGTVITFW